MAKTRYRGADTATKLVKARAEIRTLKGVIETMDRNIKGLVGQNVELHKKLDRDKNRERVKTLERSLATAEERIAELEVLLDSETTRRMRTDHNMRRHMEQAERLEVELEVERLRSRGRLNLLAVLADHTGEIPPAKVVAELELARRHKLAVEAEQAGNPHLS